MILDAHTKKSIKLCQELVDSCFLYMRYHNNPDLDTTPYKQTMSKKRLTKALESMHEFLEGTGKLVKMKPDNKITSYKSHSGKETKYVTIITK